NQLYSIETDTVITTNNLLLQDIEIIDFNELRKEVSDNTFEAIFNLDRIASIMFTSGTTGPQKAVPQTFSNHYASAVGCKESLGFGQDTKWLS
ncbi:2-succinylbenzoate-CoA ligase, partial [Mesorhizobium sp. M4B.F.Ca.ET.214.01.1.1]